MTEMTHADLVTRAARWLRYSCRLRTSYLVDGKRHWDTLRCAVVFTELVTSASETPDAIGFADCGLTSVVVECKISRADFLADCKKRHRLRDPFGMGQYRFIMAPSGLLMRSEIPAGWGLLSVEGRRVTVEKEAIPRKAYRVDERRLLWSYCRRQQVKERETAP